MRTTIDLPEEMVERIKIAAARRRTTMKSLFIQGLESVLEDEVVPGPSAEAVDRLRKGYRLGGRPLAREEIHAR